MALQTSLVAEGYAEALSRVTGTPVVARHTPDYSEVSFQDPRATGRWIEQQLKPAPPGAVRVNFGPAVYPTLIKQALPWALGLIAVGWVLGSRS